MIKSNFFDNIKTKLDKIDGSDLKNIFRELADEYTNMKTVFNSMAEGVLVIDRNEHVILYNKMACRFYDINMISEGMELKDVINDRRIYTIIRKLINKSDRIVSEEVKVEYDDMTYIHFSAHPLVKEGKIIGSIIIAENISEKKESENKLKQMESIEALTSLTAGIAHEIKNPLGAISIHVQLLEQEIKKCKCPVSDDLRYSLNIVNEEIERLNEIVVNFLYSVRPLKTNLLLIDLEEYLGKVLELITPELKAKNIRLVKIFHNLPKVWLDENVFKQALLNLIQNSIAAINGEDGLISIEAYREKSYVYISIKDNGQGIPDEIQTKIFDPYFTTKSYGSGLGLTIVYKIVREHKGEIIFSSGNGETVFTIKLPVPFTEKGLIEYSGE